jgi:prepilin-type N-terminal cleavage/methylation domain-containing protein
MIRAFCHAIASRRYISKDPFESLTSRLEIGSFAPSLFPCVKSFMHDSALKKKTKHCILDCLSLYQSSLGKGFSLIELLVVIAVIGILASLSIPAIHSIGSARTSIDAAYKISDAIELARSEAIARRTFVWLGLENTTDYGNRNLRVGLVYSKDGSTNINSDNLQPISRPVLLERIGLVGAADTGINNSKYANANALATSTAGVTFSVGSQGFTNKTITFTPTGEAMLTGLPTSSTSFEPQILIGLRVFRGATEATNNDIAVVVDGSLGIPTIFRKE